MKPIIRPMVCVDVWESSDPDEAQVFATFEHPYGSESVTIELPAKGCPTQGKWYDLAIMEHCKMNDGKELEWV